MNKNNFGNPNMQILLFGNIKTVKKKCQDFHMTFYMQPCDAKIK